ncbi:hypothetical protein KY289_030687 [Solanum tuberosum]|nr:hypothetical protein KY289_030687 [Solanum tuberosum]
MSKPESPHNGMPVVIFKSSDYYGVMAEECRYTIIGKPGMAKVRIEVDLMTKPKLRSVWIRQDDTDNPLKGFYQKLEYEGVAKALEREKVLKSKENAIKKNATVSTDNGTKIAKGINVADFNDTFANNIDKTIASTSKVLVLKVDKISTAKVIS